MAFKAKDGKAFGNRQQQRAYDERAPKEQPEAKADGESDGGDGQDVSHQPIEDVVAQHGPAEKIELQHDHEGGQHHVHSHHGGKHHKSSHGSADEAHMHAAKAAGLNPEEQGEPQQYEAGEHEGAQEYGIPGM